MPMPTDEYSKVPTYIESAGLYSLYYPADIRRHSKYTLDFSRTNATLDDVASGTKMKGKASIGMTWNGTNKRVFAYADLVASDGTLIRVNTNDNTDLHKFYVDDPGNSGQRRVAVACGVSEIGPSQYDASVLFITTDPPRPVPDQRGRRGAAYRSATDRRDQWPGAVRPGRVAYLMIGIVPLDRDQFLS